MTALLSPVLAQPSTPTNNSTSAPPAKTPGSTAVPQTVSAAAADIGHAHTTFRTQNRECWICARIASQIDADKKLSDDDKWHFLTCVTSWERLSGKKIV